MDIINETICCPFGIGDIIIIKQYSIIMNINFKIFLINRDLLNYRVNGMNHFKFITKFIKRIFGNHCKIILDDNKTMIDTSILNQQMEIFNLYKLYNFTFEYSNSLFKEKYIIFHTKCRFDQSGKNGFLRDLPTINNFIDNFKSKYNIILFGEKEPENNYENIVHGVQSIYSTLIKLKNKNNVIDLTSDIISSSNDINNFENDLHIINKASLNVTFGHGGPFCICNSFSDNNLCYIGDIIHHMPDCYRSKNFIHTDINKFLEQLSSFSI